MFRTILFITLLVIFVGASVFGGNDNTNLPIGTHEVILAPDSPWTETNNNEPVFVQVGTISEITSETKGD